MATTDAVARQATPPAPTVAIDEHPRAPCPYVIIEDAGSALMLGAVGGTIWHGFKGYRASPLGQGRAGALAAIKTRVPPLTGNFAAWGGLFSAFDCAVKGVREKEDPWNSIAAGALTGGALAVRGGFAAVGRNAFASGALLAMFEGVGIGLNRVMTKNLRL